MSRVIYTISMAEMKSALELALERTAGVKSDPRSIEAHSYRQIGKRLVARLSDDSSFDLRQELKRYTKEQHGWIREGFLQIIMANLSLPSNEEDMGKFTILHRGLSAMVKNVSKLNHIMEQVNRAASAYLDEKRRLIETLRSQFAIRNREREEELSRKMGMSVQLDPATDPEFGALLKQHLLALQDHYAAMLEQAREPILNLSWIP